MKLTATALLFLVATVAVAQQRGTAQLTGVVTVGGQPLAGVTVMLSSEGLQSPRVTETGQNGGYFFALLAPGDYLIRFDREGFAPAARKARLLLATIGRVDAELQPAVIAETMIVEAERSSGFDGALIASDVSGSQLAYLPVTRDIAGAVGLSSNANALAPHNRIVVAGAPSWDTLYVVDGVAVSEYLTGQPHNVFIEDAIEEIAVQTGAISAEYGRFTGGVVLALTKRGGNAYHGSFRDAMANPAWTLRTPWRGQPEPAGHINHSVEATLGGFLLKDRLWFFAAGRIASNTNQSFTTRTNIAYTATSDEERWAVKLIGQLTPSHSLIASYVNTILDERNATDLRGSGRVVDLGALIEKRSSPLNIVALTDEAVLTKDAFVELHASNKRSALRGNGGRSADRIAGTLIAARNLNANANAPLGCGICGDDARMNSSFSAKASRYRSTRTGNHAITAGAEVFRERRKNAGTRSASEFNIQASARIDGANAYPQFDSNSLIVWNRPHASPGARFENRSAFVNDAWDVVPRFHVNAGVRYDRIHARDGVGLRIGNDAAWSPRLSATFDVRNDGRHEVSASYGRYASRILESGGAPQQIGVFDQFGWRYLGPPINVAGAPLVSAPEALRRLFAWFDSTGGVRNPNVAFFTDPIATTMFPAPLQSPSADERTLGYAFQFGSGYLRADAVARDWHHFYAGRVDTTTGRGVDAAGKPIDVAWVVNDDAGTKRSYRALQVQGAWHRGRSSAGGSYTLSRLHGNDDEEEGTLNAPRNLPLRLWYPEFLAYARRRPAGDLLQDQRHRSRLWAGYELTVGRGSLTGFLLQSLESGHPYSIAGQIDPTGQTPGSGYEGIAKNPGYVLNQVKMGAYYFSKRGAYRTDRMLQTDLGATYEIPLRRARISFKGAITNLFNSAAVVSVSTEVSTFTTAGSGLKAFNPFTAVPIEGVHYKLGPGFGRPTGPDSYQVPRSFQCSIGARF